MTSIPRQRLALFATCVGLGAFLLLVAGDLIPGLEPRPDDAPSPIIALSGLVFIIAGCMTILGSRARTSDLLAGILCLTFGIIGAWVSLRGSDQGFSGGVPFLPPEFNVRLARGAFGVGSLICFMLAFWALRRFAARIGDPN